MSLTKRIAVNTVAMILAKFGRQFLSMAFAVLVARKLGVEDFGRYGVVMSLVTIFITFSNMGLQNLLVREVARQPSLVNRFFFSVTSLTVPVSLVAWVGLIGIAHLLDYDQRTMQAIYVVGLMLVPYSISFVQESLFQGLEQMRYISYTTLIAYTIQLGLGLGILLWKPSLLGVTWVIVTVELFVVLLYFYFGHRYLSIPGHWSRTDMDFKLGLHLARESISFILISILSTILLNSDLLLLSKLQDETAVGLYRAASRLAQFGLTLIFSYATAIFPVMSSLSTDKLQHTVLETLTARSVRYLVVAMLPVAVLGTALAQPLGQVVFGHQYAGVESALRILLWALVPVGITQVLSRSIFVRNQQQAIPWFLLLGIALNLGLGFWWVPTGSYIATSWAMLLARSLVAVLTFGWAVHCRAAGWDTLRSLIRPALCAALLALFLFLFKKENFIVLLAVGTGLYGALLLLLRALPHEDVALLHRTVHGPVSRGG